MGPLVQSKRRLLVPLAVLFAVVGRRAGRRGADSVGVTIHLPLGHA